MNDKIDKVWECWILSEIDIQDECKAQNIDYSKITGEQKEEIARRFKKGIEWILTDDWSDILFAAIREVKK